MNFATTLEALNALAQNVAPNVAPLCTLFTSTMPRLRKNTQYPMGVIRNAARQGQIGMSYTSCTNKLLARQNSPEAAFFVAGELWKGKGQHVENNRYLVEHVDTHQLYICFRPATIAGEVQISWDKWLNAQTGEEIECPTHLFYANNQPPDRCLWRTIKLENVLAFKCGEIYNIGE